MSIGCEGAADEVLHMFRLLVASYTQTSVPLPSRPHTMHAGVDSNANYYCQVILDVCCSDIYVCCCEISLHYKPHTPLLLHNA